MYKIGQAYFTIHDTLVHYPKMDSNTFNPLLNKSKKMVFGWGKKKEIKDETLNITPRYIRLSDVLDIINSAKKEQSEQLVTHAKQLRDPITYHVDALLQIAIQLEKDPLNTEDIDVNIATIVKRGKKQVLDTIHKESKRNFSEIHTVDDVRIFHRQSSQTLTRIGDILGKQTRVIHIFAKKYAGKLKEILAKYTDDTSHLQRLLTRYETFEQNYNKIAEMLNKINKENQTIQNNTEKITSMQTKIDTLSDNLSSLNDNISKFKKTENYKKYQKIKIELNQLCSKKSSIEHEINNQTILISRPISKYEYGSSLDKEQKILVEKFLSSPFDVFLSANKSELVMILDNVKKSISLGHMSVKEPEKTINYLDDITSKLDTFIAQVESFLNEQNTLNEQLTHLDLDVLTDYEKQYSKTDSDIEFSRSRIKEIQAEIDTLASNRPVYTQNVESALNRIGTIHYTIKE